MPETRASTPRVVAADERDTMALLRHDTGDPALPGHCGALIVRLVTTGRQRTYPPGVRPQREVAPALAAGDAARAGTDGPAQALSTLALYARSVHGAESTTAVTTFLDWDTHTITYSSAGPASGPYAA
ncbi:hypothetical protein ACH4U3_30320 [Streptomyces griseoruber]|uniref:hypothetical protein n=1 Tax=Streptomyces griseoruber TaxID=1943 RepID=UPI003792603C